MQCLNVAVKTSPSANPVPRLRWELGEGEASSRAEPHSQKMWLPSSPEQVNPADGDVPEAYSSIPCARKRWNGNDLVTTRLMVVTSSKN